MFQFSMKCVFTIHELVKHWRQTFQRGLGLDELPRSMRPLAWGGSTSAVGSGMWFTVWALFLTRRVGLTGPQAGIALTIAGIVGFLAPVPLGRLADQRGPREVYAALLAAEGVAVSGFLLCHSFLEVVLVASVTAACDQGKTGVRAALITQLASGEGRVGALACLRACSHAGDALGAGLGALVIGIGSGPAYGAAILFNAISYLTYAATLRGVPHVAPRAAPTPAPTPGTRRGGGDLPFIALAVICGVLTLCWGLMSAGLPLWIAGHTRAPRAIAGIIILISSVAIAGLQVTFSRTVTTPRTASRAALRAGLSLAVCCGLVAVAAAPAALPATLLLLSGGIAHVLGELWFVAASWGLSVPLMRPDRAAEDQGIFATGEALAIMLAPALMTAVIIPGGPAAWLALGAVFALAGASARPAALWAVRTRPDVR
jgi:MFS family permease